MDPRWLQNFMHIDGNVTLVVDFDQDVLQARIEQPPARISCSAPDCFLADQELVLAKVIESNNHDHSQFVGRFKNAQKPVHMGWLQFALRVDRGIDPRLDSLGFRDRHAALKIHGNRRATVGEVVRHCRDELVDVALRVPFAGVRIRPVLHSFRVFVVKNSLPPSCN